MKNVVLITRDECTYCDNAKALLKMNNIKFTEYYMGLDYTREEVLEKYPTQKTLPIVLINDELIGGYTELFDRLRGKDEIQ
jgi:glutaredoxin